MTDERFSTVPDGWEVAAPDRLARGVDIAKSVLDRPGVVDDVAAYYQRESNYAGATFLDVDPSDPYAVTSGDLLAITLLSVKRGATSCPATARDDGNESRPSAPVDRGRSSS